MFERNLAHWARARQEVTVTTGSDIASDDRRDHVGYLAGMDEGWLELCLATAASRVLLARDDVVSVRTDGRTVDDVALENPDLAAAINSRIRHFVKMCEGALARERAADRGR